MRALISLFVAVVLAIAVTPGSMAMPAPQTMKMDCAATPSCDHMKTQKEHGKPCKDMAVCLGMLSCFGMAAVDVSRIAPLPVTYDVHVAIAHQTVSGLTLQPDNPPPIA